MRYIFFLFILFSVISVKSQNNIKSFQSVISAEAGEEWVFGKNYKNWQPSDDDINTAEKLLLQAFEDQKRGTINRLLNKSLDDYDRQFIGAIDESGDKIIWINLFCKSEEISFKDWKNKLVFVKDGGKCYFNLKVNITKNIYTDFMVNGEG